MPSNLDKLKELTNKLEEKLSQQDIIESVISEEELLFDFNIKSIRRSNIYKVEKLYKKLSISDKSPKFNELFLYKAMNLSGIGLREDEFGEVREGKYVQIIAITYELDERGKKKAKNVSLGYFGKAQNLSLEQKKDIIEFVLRWRYEKAFQTLEHYNKLISKISEL